MLESVFGQTTHVSWEQECARAALIFFFGLALVRIAGRRVFGKWAALDIIVSIVIGSNLSRALTGSAELWGTLLATALLVGLHWLLSHACVRWQNVSRVLEGKPVRLGGEGGLDDGQLLWHAVSAADIEEALRSAGLQSVSGARLIVLEPSGKLSVLKKPVQ